MKIRKPKHKHKLSKYNTYGSSFLSTLMTNSTHTITSLGFSFSITSAQTYQSISRTLIITPKKHYKIKNRKR